MLHLSGTLMMVKPLFNNHLVVHVMLNGKMNLHILTEPFSPTLEGKQHESNELAKP
jgi:hypothetical protein